MVTRLEICKLALKELVRQWDETPSNVPHSEQLRKDILYVAERIVALENEYESNLKG